MATPSWPLWQPVLARVLFFEWRALRFEEVVCGRLEAAASARLADDTKLREAPNRRLAFAVKAEAAVCFARAKK